MPELLDIYLGYNFYVKSDGDNEPVHVHVAKGYPEHATKFWITADSVELAKDYGTVEAKDMSKVLRYIRKNRARMLEIWLAHFKHAELKR